MVVRLVRDAGAEVGDDGESEDLHGHVIGDHRLPHRGHTYLISTEHADHPHLGGRLVGWTHHAEIHALLKGNVLARGQFQRETAQARTIHLGLIREARTHRGIVRAHQRVHTSEVDVIGHHNQIPNLVAGVDAASRVGEDDLAHSHGTGEPHVVHRRVHTVTLVAMNAAIEGQQELVVHWHREQPATVSRYTRRRHPRHLSVGQHNYTSYSIEHLAEPTTQHDGLGVLAIAKGRVGSLNRILKLTHLSPHCCRVTAV